MFGTASLLILSGEAAARGTVPSTGLSVVVVGLLLFIGTATAGSSCCAPGRCNPSRLRSSVPITISFRSAQSDGFSVAERIRDHLHTLLGCPCGRDRDRIG